MKSYQILSILLSIFLFTAPAIAQDHFNNIDRADWWNEPWPQVYPEDESASLDFIKVNKNKFVNEKGEVVVFKGLSIADPDKIEKDGKWGKPHFEVIQSWGVNLVRIPVHPVALRERGIKAYLKLLDDAVQWCGELGMYVIIDWHSIGNLKMEIYQHDMYETTKRETYHFWKTIARHFKGVSTVAFYEVYNEPTVYNGTLGTLFLE